LAAGDIHVAERDVVKDTGCGGQLTAGLTGIARFRALLGELVRRQNVINVIGISLLAVFLINQRLNTSHRRRSKGRTAAAQQ
jgi:hypothetical protein